MSFGMQRLHVLRHAESDLTRPARQARGGLLEPDPPQRITTLGLQDWKYWKIGKTVRIGGLMIGKTARTGGLDA